MCAVAYEEVLTEQVPWRQESDDTILVLSISVFLLSSALSGYCHSFLVTGRTTGLPTLKQRSTHTPPRRKETMKEGKTRTE